MSPSTALRDLSIRNKLVAAFVALVILFGALGAIAVQKFATMNAVARTATSGSSEAIRYLNDMRIAFMSC